MFRKVAAAVVVFGVPAAAYVGFKWLSHAVSVPVLLGASAVFVFGCWKVANWFDARAVARSAGNSAPLAGPQAHQPKP